MASSGNNNTNANDGKYTAAMIFLHGLGDTGQGWSDTIGAIIPPYCKLICPTAPSIPITLNGGMKMTSWFDLMALSADGPEDIEGIKKANSLVLKMIEEEEAKHSIPCNRILIGGFSQGGALALHTALRHPKSLAGVLAFSCWLPLHKEYPAALNQANKGVPVFQCHGDIDLIVPRIWGNKTADILRPLLTTYDFKVYQGLAHSSSNEELKDAAAFIAKCLPLK